MSVDDQLRELVRDEVRRGVADAMAMLPIRVTATSPQNPAAGPPGRVSGEHVASSSSNASTWPSIFERDDPDGAERIYAALAARLARRHASSSAPRALPAPTR